MILRLHEKSRGELLRWFWISCAISTSLNDIQVKMKTEWKTFIRQWKSTASCDLDSNVKDVSLITHQPGDATVFLLCYIIGHFQLNFTRVMQKFDEKCAKCKPLDDGSVVPLWLQSWCCWKNAHPFPNNNCEHAVPCMLYFKVKLLGF